jgi:hypothetical protein
VLAASRGSKHDVDSLNQNVFPCARCISVVGSLCAAIAWPLGASLVLTNISASHYGKLPALAAPAFEAPKFLIIILSSHMSLCTAFCTAPCTALSPANDSRRATGGLKATLQLVLKSSHEQPSNLPDHFLIPPANPYWSSPELCVSDRVTCCFPPVCGYNYHPHYYRCSEPLAMTS